MADEFMKAALYGIKTFNRKAKEKIGMQKLIKLLNEYDSGWDYDEYYGPYQYGQDSDAYHLCKYQLVSKEYGFIKWLVENDKIDTFRILEKRFDTQKGYEREHYHTVNEGNTDLLLMLLAISDTPIEDLISYLK